MGLPYKFVQGAHAVAGWLLAVEDARNIWNNETIVFIDVEDLDRLKLALYKLQVHEIELVTRPSILWFSWNEPDLNNELTAIACVSDDEEFFNQWQLAK